MTVPFAGTGSPSRTGTEFQIQTAAHQLMLHAWVVRQSWVTTTLPSGQPSPT